MSTWMRSPSAAAYRVPPGVVVATCWRCSKPVGANERTYVYEARTWYDVHRSCRYPGERERNRGR